MDAEQPRLTRSMQGLLVSNSNSKEFNFLDPERKFKHLAQNSKIGQKKDKSDISVSESGLTQPFATTVITYISKAQAAGIDKELMAPEDKRHPGNSDSKTKPNNKLGNSSGNPTGSVTNMALDDEIKTLPCTPLAATKKTAKVFKKFNLWTTRLSALIIQSVIEFREGHQKPMLQKLVIPRQSR